MDGVRTFRTYLVKEVGIGQKRVREFATAYASRDILEFRLKMAAAERTKSPLLILYFGHGDTKGWALDDTRTLEYHRLADALKEGRRPVVLVNACCHAMAAAKSFEERGVSKERLSLIAASEIDETTSGGLFMELVMDNWSQRKPNRYGPELRWGAKHDHYFFPTKPP
jgi:hypothetical protein